MSSTIIVTGASRGIGYQTALALANQNNTVIATARTRERLEELAQKNESGKIIPVTADLTKHEGIEKIREAVSGIGSLNGLINNAGALGKKPFMETTMEDWQQVMDVNVYAIVRLTQAVKSFFKDGSHIVNISSMSGFQGSLKFPGLSIYAAAKAAVIGLSEVLSVEFAEDDISVNCICPGAVQTEMVKQAFPGFEPPVTAQQMGAYLADFVLTGHQLYNGQVLPVALNNPE